eukprot:12968861-Alexandrium_andersonii.AAC.1
MSASLVGSEMCIRDSRGAPRRSEELRGAPQSSEELRGAQESSGERGAPAVSYTHLTLPTICSV